MDDLDDVWKQYQTDQSPETRNRLLLQYAPLVKYVAGRVPGDSLETVERGLESLKASIDSYEPGNGCRFENYALERLNDAYSWEEGWI